MQTPGEKGFIIIAVMNFLSPLGKPLYFEDNKNKVQWIILSRSSKVRELGQEL